METPQEREERIRQLLKAPRVRPPRKEERIEQLLELLRLDLD